MIDIKTQTRILEANAIWHGIKTIDMMENAGKGIAETLIRKYGKGKSYCIISGHGNNGGDGFVTARYLLQNDKSAKVVSILIGRESDINTSEARQNFLKLKELQKTSKNLDVIQDGYSTDIAPCDIVVECLIGTGIKGKLNKRFEDVVKRIAKMKSERVAIDMPVPLYKHTFAISFHFEKIKNAEVVNIGIPSKVDQYTGPGQVRELYFPPDDAYKSKTGELFVFGGSHKFHGAPLMSIKAASKFIGSVYFYTTPNNRTILDDIKKEVYEFITVDDNEITKYAGYADALLIGPGLEDNTLNRSMIEELFEMYPEKPKVIDAYAIAMAPKNKLQNCILTPHRGELRHIWGDKTNYNTKRYESNLRRFAVETGAIIILKGHIDMLFNNDGEVKFNETGNAGMAKGGTGDIFAGLLAAFLTKNDPWLSAQAAIFLSGYAGDLTFKKFGYNYSATDLIPFLQTSVKEIRGY